MAKFRNKRSRARSADVTSFASLHDVLKEVVNKQSALADAALPVQVDSGSRSGKERSMADSHLTSGGEASDADRFIAVAQKSKFTIGLKSCARNRSETQNRA